MAKEIIIDFKLSKVADHSALMAIDSLANKYKLAGKKLHLVHLSPDCLEVLESAKKMVEIKTKEGIIILVANNNDILQSFIKTK